MGAYIEGTKWVYDSVKERSENVIGKRLQQARMERGLSLTGLGELLAKSGLTVHRQGISKWETGGSVPNAYQLVAICHALEIEDGITYFTQTQTKQTLDERGRQKLREYRDDLIASGRYRPSAVVNSGNIEYIEMRVSTLAVSAGTGAFLDEESFEKLRFPAHMVPANADFGVRVQGDSMEPVYHDGQIVWVQSCTSLRPGEVGIFVCDGEGFLKVYEEREPDAEKLEEYVDSGGVLHLQPVLVSYNESYEPRIIAPSSSFQIAGRVLN